MLSSCSLCVYLVTCHDISSSTVLFINLCIAISGAFFSAKFRIFFFNVIVVLPFSHAGIKHYLHSFFTILSKVLMQESITIFILSSHSILITYASVNQCLHFFITIISKSTMQEFSSIVILSSLITYSLLQELTNIVFFHPSFYSNPSSES